MSDNNRKVYKHFTLDERLQISILRKKGYSARDIGDALEKNHSSIVREINNNQTKGVYDPWKAHFKAKVKRLNSKYAGMKINEYAKLEKYIKKKLKKHWTPEQIAGRWNRKKKHQDEQNIISAPSIYKYLYSPYGQALCGYLPSKQYSRNPRKGKHKPKREMIKNRVSIDLRPDKVNSRKEFGHFEGDTLSKIKSDQEAIAGLIERISRKAFFKKVPRLKYTINGFKECLNPQSDIVKSCTLDNGVENKKHQDLGVDTYFCDPYSSWQKGSVENTFLRLRRFIPKGKSLKNYSAKDIQKIENIMNSTPRKCLNFKTPNEVFAEYYQKEIKKINTS